MEKKTEHQMPAFPQSEPYTSQEGMTLLDYMAAKVMMGLYTGDGECVDSEEDFKEVARFSYAQAAAMLEERKKYIQ